MSAPATVTVSVTQEHINQGERNNCGECPVALAFDAAMPEAIDSSVTWGYASVWLEAQQAVTYELPLEAKDFIQDFDEGSPVAPLTFEARKVRP